MAEIARAADVSTQTVFNYFPTKEDLVYWRLESFEDELLSTIRERAAGRVGLAAFGRFVRAPRGMLGDYDAETRERLAALTRMIVASPALLAREQQIFAGYTEALAELLGERHPGAGRGERDDGRAPRAGGLHARRIVAGARHPELAGEVRAQADAALALLERGLGDYAARV